LKLSFAFELFADNLPEPARIDLEVAFVTETRAMTRSDLPPNTFD
jgi:hypothetical protein